MGIKDEMRSARARVIRAEKAIKKILVHLERETGCSLDSITMTDERITVSGQPLIRALEIDIKMVL